MTRRLIAILALSAALAACTTPAASPNPTVDGGGVPTPASEAPSGLESPAGGLESPGLESPDASPSDAMASPAAS